MPSDQTVMWRGRHQQVDRDLRTPSDRDRGNDAADDRIPSRRDHVTPTKLDRQSTHALFTTALAVVLGLLLSVLIARTLGPAGKGVLDVASATAALFTLVLGASLNSAITHHIARRGETPTGLVGQLGLWAVAAAGVCALCLAAQPALSTRLGLLPVGNNRFWIMFIAVTVAFSVWATGLRGILVGQNSLITCNRIDLAIKAALLACYMVLAMTMAPRPETFALAGIGSAMVLALALAIALPRATGAAAGTWPMLLTIALPVHGTNVLHFLNQRADIFFLHAFHGAADVGLYALAVSLAQCVLLVSSALALPLLPEVSAASSPAAAASATARTCRMFVAFGLFAAGVLALSATWLVPLLFGRDFSGSLPSLLVLLPGMIAFGLTNVLISYFVGVQQSRVNVWISLIAFAATVGGNIWLTRTYGAIGAALTSTLAYSLAGAISLLRFTRQTQLRLIDTIVPTSADWRAALTVFARFRL